MANWAKVAIRGARVEGLWEAIIVTLEKEALV